MQNLDAELNQLIDRKFQLIEINEPLEAHFFATHNALAALHERRSKGEYVPSAAVLDACDKRMIAGHSWHPTREEQKQVEAAIEAIRDHFEKLAARRRSFGPPGSPAGRRSRAEVKPGEIPEGVQETETGDWIEDEAPRKKVPVRCQNAMWEAFNGVAWRPFKDGPVSDLMRAVLDEWPDAEVSLPEE